MSQLLLCCSGADRDPSNAMRWLGSSTAHLFEVRDFTVTAVATASVGCNAMSAVELPGATAESTLVLTDMADLHGTGSGGLALYTASRAGIVLASSRQCHANTGGRSPCAVALCPTPFGKHGLHVVAVACYEGPNEESDGVVTLVGVQREADERAGWAFSGRAEQDAQSVC